MKATLSERHASHIIETTRRWGNPPISWRALVGPVMLAAGAIFFGVIDEKDVAWFLGILLLGTLFFWFLWWERNGFVALIEARDAEIAKLKTQASPDASGSPTE